MQSINFDNEIAIRLLTLWCETSEEAFKNIYTALDNKNLRAIEEEAHNLKSTAATLGLLELQDCASGLQNYCTDGTQINFIKEFVDRSYKVYKKSEDFVKAELTVLKN